MLETIVPAGQSTTFYCIVRYLANAMIDSRVPTYIQYLRASAYYSYHQPLFISNLKIKVRTFGSVLCIVVYSYIRTSTYSTVVPVHM